jgi:adenosylhomocysteine nucleosidase
MGDFNSLDIGVLISANVEWSTAKKILTPAEVYSTPFGEWFSIKVNNESIAFIQGGWGKISAAASTQYVIDRWHPKSLINLGTCGGFAGMIKKCEVLLVEETVIYDIVEQMGDPDQALQAYTTHIDLSWLHNPPPVPFQRARLISADRDICPAELPLLINQYHATAADWESGAIAWVSERNQIRCLILRGVSDMVSEQGGEAYGNMELFIQGTHQVMKILLNQLPFWITALHSGDQLSLVTDE